VVALGCAVLVACGPAEQPRELDSGMPVAKSRRWPRCITDPGDARGGAARSCAQQERAVKAWGPVPWATPPAPSCPMRVRVAGDDVVAEPLTLANAFEPVPWGECVPPAYTVGARRVLRVEDGFLIAYDGLFHGETMWTSEDGSERRRVSGARVVGFARAPSGIVLALAIGRARLGRGGVLALEHRGRGEWSSRLLAVLPVEPSPVAFDDHGVLVGFAEGFVFRADETGAVENVHYVARALGRVASIARSANGTYFLGVECGVVRLVPVLASDGERPFREEWWSSRDGASGKWTACFDG
jgi:hypothetical protein